jgi:hypothetical protein
MKRHSMLLIAVLVGLIGSVSATRVDAQTPKFKEGDRIEVDTTHVDVLHGGNPAFQSWSKGTITKVDTQYSRYIIQLDPLPGKMPVMHSIPMYDQDCCIRAFGGAAPTIKSDTLHVDEYGTVLADRPLLDCDNLKHDGRNGQPLPVELAKKLIRCLYEKASPAGQDGATTMDIVEFNPGAARKWILYQDQGQGSLNTLVYAIHVKYNVKTFYRSRDLVTTGKEMTFTCFADNTNLWQCGFATGPNKEGKKEEILVKPGAQTANQSEQSTAAASAATTSSSQTATVNQTAAVTDQAATMTATTTATNSQTTTNPAATEGAQPAKKKGGFLNKLNDKMQKASQKIQNAAGQASGNRQTGSGKP